MHDLKIRKQIYMYLLPASFINLSSNFISFINDKQGLYQSKNAKNAVFCHKNLTKSLDENVM